jgi:hypothetical protein
VIQDEEELEMKLMTGLVVIPLLAALSTPALADRGYRDDYRAQHFDQRFDRQHWRIKQGVKSGELTRKEARKLRKQQRRIDRLERRFSSDGYLDRRERRVLRKKQNRASERIYRYKHNDRYRYPDEQVVYEAPASHGNWSFTLTLSDFL